MNTLILRGLEGPATAFDTMCGDTRFGLVSGEGVAEYHGNNWTIRFVRGGLAEAHVELVTSDGEVVEAHAGTREAMARQAYTWLRLYGDAADQATCPAPAPLVSAHDWSDVELGDLVESMAGRTSPPVAACRTVLLDVLHARAWNVAAQARGPHFCSQACYAGHATEYELAGDDAAACATAEHFARYPDETPESIAAHVDAHLTDRRARQP